MCSQSHQFKNEERIYLNTLISDLIDAKYWDLLQILSEMNEKYIDCTHSTKIAKLGSIEGLRALRSVAKDRYYEMILVAAEKGHSAFLREMDTFGLLQKSVVLLFVPLHQMAGLNAWNSLLIVLELNV